MVCNECPLLSLTVVLVGRFLCMSLGKGEGGKKKIKNCREIERGRRREGCFSFWEFLRDCLIGR